VDRQHKWQLKDIRIHVHVDVVEVELLDRVDGRVFVGRSRVRALSDVHVCHHVGERIGLDDGDDANSRVRLDGGNNSVDVPARIRHENASMSTFGQ